MDPTFTQQYEALAARARVRTIPYWATALISLFLGPIAFLVRGPRQELWDGGDHLLIVENLSYGERYRRVRYQDIEVLQHWPNARDWLPAVVLFGLGALAYLGFAGYILVTSFEDALFVGPAVLFGAILAGACLDHLLRGATVKVRLRTGVQVLDLHAIARRRVADRVLPVLRQRIIAAQEVAPTPVIPAPANPTNPANPTPANVAADPAPGAPARVPESGTP